MPLPKTRDSLNGYRSVTSGLSRRAFLRMAGISMAALASGCETVLPTNAPNNAEFIHLVYQDWNTDWFPPMAQDMLRQFHDTHQSIRAFYTPDPEDLTVQMPIDMRARTAPDVFQGCCVHFPTWAQSGYALDLRPYVEADLDQATIDDWDAAQYQSFFLKDGLQYGLPKYHGALAIYYNKDLFDTYGVDYPDGSWNYDDYLEAMKKLTHDRDEDGETDLWGSVTDISWDRIQIHVNGWGGHFVDPDDNTRCLMGSPESLAAMEWLRARMWDDNVMATPLDLQTMSPSQAFIDQRVAMAEDGSWALKDILANSDFRVGVAPFPTGPVRKVTLATTDGFGIFSGTRYPDAAWELLKFLISPEYGRAMARANFLQPARASLVPDWIRYIQEEFPEKSKDVDIAAFADGHVNGYSVTTEIFPQMAQVKQITYEAWDKIFLLGRAPTELMQDACQTIQAILSGTG